MAQTVDQPENDQGLRKSLHDKIDQLDTRQLASLNQMVLALEIKELRQKLDSAFDEDREEQKITPSTVGAAVALHRKRHPYNQ